MRRSCMVLALVVAAVSAGTCGCDASRLLWPSLVGALPAVGYLVGLQVDRKSVAQGVEEWSANSGLMLPAWGETAGGPVLRASLEVWYGSVASFNCLESSLNEGLTDADAVVDWFWGRGMTGGRWVTHPPNSNTLLLWHAAATCTRLEELQSDVQTVIASVGIATGVEARRGIGANYFSVRTQLELPVEVADGSIFEVGVGFGKTAKTVTYQAELSQTWIDVTDDNWYRDHIGRGFGGLAFSATRRW